MGRIHRRFDVQAPVDDVYAAIHGTPELIAEGAPDLRLERLDPGPIKVGSRMRYSVVLPGGIPFECDLRHTRVDPGRQVEWEFTSGLSGSGSYRYQANSDGSTRVEFELDYQLPGGRLANLATGRIVQGRLEEALDRAFANLRGRVEGQSQAD